MIKIFISQPMKDKTNEQIEAERKRVFHRVSASGIRSGSFFLQIKKEFLKEALKL